MSEEWQISFKVKGLRAPEKEIVFDDNILMRGVPRSDSSYVYFKFTLQNEEERDKIRHDFINTLRNITQMYGLVTNAYVEVLSSSVMTKISSENSFGHAKISPEFRLKLGIGHEQRIKNIPFLNKTMTKYKLVNAIFQDKNKAFLRNAIDYYYRSLRDFRLEEKLIDLMISLESLFSGDTQELRLRISLRASSLLCIGQECERPKIYENIYSLYKKRSKVVHGTEVVDLNVFEISTLQEYAREAIKRLIHIEMTKKNILKLLDESVYDKEKMEMLNQEILEAIEKW